VNERSIKKFAGDLNTHMGIASSIKGFLADDFNKLLLVALALLGLLAFALTPAPAAEETGASFIHFFYLPTCPHCHEQMTQLNPVLEARYNIEIIAHDVSTPEGNALFSEVCQNNGLQGLIPTTLVGNEVFVGYSAEIGVEIEDAVKACLDGECADPLTGATCAASKQQDYFLELPFLGKTDLRSLSLPALAVVLGLVDGFNPCAMWVLIYLIALLAGVNDKRKIWLVVGTFVAASGILYFLFMAAWLNAFLFIGYLRGVTLLIGLVALGAGTLNVKEYFETRGKPLTCKVGDGESKAKTMKQIDSLVNSPLTWGTLAGLVVLAFVVNSIEFVCSAALPAIFAQVLSLANLSALEHYAYIALYTLAFMLDDLVIFGLAVFSINAASTNEKYVRFSHIIGGVLLLALGLMLLFAPELLH